MSGLHFEERKEMVYFPASESKEETIVKRVKIGPYR